MDLNQYNFSIHITTKNRYKDLIFTLNKINYLLDRGDVEVIVFDDGSTDGTFEKIEKKISPYKNSSK